MMRPILSFVFLCLCTAPSFAGPRSGNDLVKAQLFADVSTIEPGKPFTVGVLFKIEPGWHIYWTNPGDAGTPTEVKFELPPGFQISEIRYPVPHRFDEPGDITAYGYQDEVMLFATITPPEDLKIDGSVLISVQSSWLVCEKICLPGEATSKLTMTAASQSPRVDDALFTKWKSRLPVPAEKLAGVQAAAVAPLKLNGGNGSTEILVSRSDNGLQVIPGLLSGASVSVGTPKRSERGMTVQLAVTVLPGQNIEADSIHVLLIFPADENPVAYDVTVPIVK